MAFIRCQQLLSVSALLLLCACAVGPDYVRPQQDTPEGFKEMQNWKPAEPRDDDFRGEWWTIFNDPVLNTLEAQIEVSNQNLAQAEAQFRQAAALARAARAGFFPTLTGTTASTRAKAPDSRSAAAKPGADPSSNEAVTTDTIRLDASWEVDVWGRIRRGVEANEAGLDASAADVETARLSIQTTLAQTYFQLRATDTQRKLLDDSIAAYEKSLQLANNQYAAGIVSRADVIQAETQLKTTQAQAVDFGIQRAQLEHAIALLVGKAPADFSLAPESLAATLPAIPVGLPSDLVERRPDIAAAERRVAAANAQIGVATSAYFPTFVLSAGSGYESTSSSTIDWISAPNRFWSIGAALAQTIFSGGLRRAQTDQAIAAYDASVAVYRQSVLNGFKEVEDNLAALHVLDQEAQVQEQAVTNARALLAITINQYRAGLVSYLNVAAAQTVALNNERAQADIESRRLIASVLLIKALGGGWTAAKTTAQSQTR